MGEAAAVFVVAASDVVRAGLESLVEADARFTVVGSAPDLSDFATHPADAVTPDVILFYAERQDEQTFDALQAFVEEEDEGAEPVALVLIGAEQSEALAEALRVGVVRALLPRTASGGEIVAAIEAVAAGLYALDAGTFAALFSPTPSTVRDLPGDRLDEERISSAESQLDALTPREREVLVMLAEGLSNKEIAWRMNISEHTVKFHVASVFAKLEVSTRTEAVMQGIRRGLVML